MSGVAAQAESLSLNYRRFALLVSFVVLTVVAVQLLLPLEGGSMNSSGGAAGGSPEEPPDNEPPDDESVGTRIQRRARELWYLYNN